MNINKFYNLFLNLIFIFVISFQSVYSSCDCVLCDEKVLQLELVDVAQINNVDIMINQVVLVLV